MRSFVLIIITMFAWLNFPANAAEGMNQATFSQISDQVIKSAESLNFPTPKFKELGTVSYTQEKPKNVTYGHYRIEKVNSSLTKLSSAGTHNFETRDVAYDLFFGGFLNEGSTNKHDLRSTGSGISVGGLIELIGSNKMNMKSSNNLKFLPASFSHTMIIESQVTELKVLSGQLFPLKVGNKLIIQRASTNSMEKGKSRSNTLEYEVTKQINDYLLNNSKLPGDVFEITVHSELSKKSASLPPKILFSSHLGWVVEAHIGNTIEKAVGWN